MRCLMGLGSFARMWTSSRCVFSFTHWSSNCTQDTRSYLFTQDGEFAYSHRLRPGVNRNSHGLKVAKMSGMPPAVLEIAAGALAWMDGGEGREMVGDREGLNRLGARLAAGVSVK